MAFFKKLKRPCPPSKIVKSTAYLLKRENTNLKQTKLYSLHCSIDIVTIRILPLSTRLFIKLLLKITQTFFLLSICNLRMISVSLELLPHGKIFISRLKLVKQQTKQNYDCQKSYIAPLFAPLSVSAPRLTKISPIGEVLPTFGIPNLD